MKVVVLSPHPDDESIGCGGTLRMHFEAGDTVLVVFLTSGENGGHGVSKAETATTREQEARSACEILGVQEVEFWRLADGGVTITEELVDHVAQLLSTCNRLYVPHKDEVHPDHKATWELALRAAARAAFSTEAIRGYEVWTPMGAMAEIVDISEFMEKKLDAIRAHASQVRVLKFDDAMRGLARYRGEMHSWPGGNYAEVFSSGAS